MAGYYYGKYRGKVVQNFDDQKLGRILVDVPGVIGNGGNWAMPSVPFAGSQAGVFVLPPEKSNVWVEFEEGDPEKPIWCGGFWDNEAMPDAATTPAAPVPHILLQTTAPNIIHICDGAASPLTAGGILLKSGDSTIVVGPDGIKITAAKIEIDGVLTVNNGALKVTK
jgi:hypothetical protein